jgi:hypothetical protein
MCHRLHPNHFHDPHAIRHPQQSRPVAWSREPAMVVHYPFRVLQDKREGSFSGKKAGDSDNRAREAPPIWRIFPGNASRSHP